MNQTEEGISFAVPDKIFYNPHMRFCRSFFSLAVGAIDAELRILDGFSASGIRGIRYARENKNVKSVTFLDIEKKAVAASKKNLKKAKVKGKAFEFEINKFLMTGDREVNFIELDPFGTPVPYLFSSMKGIVPLKEGYICATATDTAVLCGPHKLACMKNYHSKSLNNEFTHETGLRILIKRIAESVIEHNYGIIPLVSLSNRHYLKVLVKLEKNGEKADETVKQFGYLGFCKNCLNRFSSPTPITTCTSCSNPCEYAGPLWLGELHDAKILESMEKLNDSRAYEDQKQISKTLSCMKEEVGMPPYFYHLHSLIKQFKVQPTPKTEEFFAQLKAKGFSCNRTHMDPLGFKTNATIEELRKLF